MFKHHARPDASAILIVVLLTLVVAAFGTPVLAMSNTARKIAAEDRDSERALFAAKAGVNYAVYLFEQGALVPTAAGAAFDSYSSAIATPLSGESFSGTMTDISETAGRGSLYRIVSNGTYGESTRQVEVVYEVNPEPAKYGFIGFSNVVLHNHSGLSGPWFKLESTIFSNGYVSVGQDLTISGSIIALDHVDLESGSIVNGGISAHSVSNAGIVNGGVKTVAAVTKLAPNATTYDLTDASGNKYAWFGGNSTAGAYSGAGVVTGPTTSYTVANGDIFNSSIFLSDGSLNLKPDVNVAAHIDPPQLDYRAMKAEADLNDPTYFTTSSAAMDYLRSKLVSETINGKTVTTIKVGTTRSPEFLYIVGDFPLTLTGTGGNNTGDNVAADGFNLEGGMYATGNVEIEGPRFDPARHPAPPDWYQVRINALPYCLPAIIAYPQPSAGTVETWTPADTPAMTGAVSGITMSERSGAGFFYFAGLTLSEGETHLHRVAYSTGLIRVVGAELAYKIHHCDFVSFTYDPNVRCTQFLGIGNGSSGAASACPHVARAVCDGTDLTTVRAYFPSSAPTPLDFTVVDANGAPVSGATLTYTKTNSFGNLTATTAKSDAFGLAHSGYTATAIGDSTVTAQGTCVDGAYNGITYSDTILVKGTQLIATMTNDCLSTVSSRTAAPSVGFTVKAQDAAGVVPNQPVTLSLAFDPTYLPSTPNYSNYQADLYVGGSLVGSTDSTGAFPTWTGTTGSTGILSGTVVLSRDAPGLGAKVNLVARAIGDRCWPASGSVSQGVTYLKLALSSADPAGCTETSPCVIAAGADAPSVVGTLSVNNVPIPGATVTFSRTDVHPPPDTPPAASLFLPTPAQATNSSGVAQVHVANNQSTSITAENPLATTVDATPTTLAGYCATPSIVPVSEKVKFLYSGSVSVGQCDADMQAAWIFLVGAKKGISTTACMHVKSTNAALDCRLKPTGIKFAVYTNTSGTATLDSTMSIVSMTGGAVHSLSSDCSGIGTGSPRVNSVALFATSCNGDVNLANNTRWDFRDAGTCKVPAGPVGPGKYFELNNVTFAGNINGPRRIDVTLYYGCDGVCSTSPPVTETWTMNGP